MLRGSSAASLTRAIARPRAGTAPSSPKSASGSVGEKDLHRALEVLLANGMRELLVVDDAGKVVGVIDQTEITAAYLARSAPAE